jgi:hypothetical protein
LVLFGLLNPRSAHAAAADEVLWMARSDGTSTFWVQIHPTGHAWLRQSSRGTRHATPPLAVKVTLELAFRVSSETYAALRAALDKLGFEPGSYATNDRVQLGIAPLPIGATHELPVADALPIADAFEAAVRARGIDHCSNFSAVLDTLNRDHATCVASAQGKASVTLRRAAGQSTASEISGTACLIASDVRSTLEKLARTEGVELVQLSARARVSEARMTLDTELPLRIDGKDLPSQAGAGLQHWSGSFAFAEGGPRQVRVQPRSEDGGDGALVELAKDATFYFPRTLWRGDLSIAVSARRGGEPLIRSAIASHGRRIARCVGVHDCAMLTIEQLRGVAASAFAECTRLKRVRVHASQKGFAVLGDEKASAHFEVVIGGQICSVSLSQYCVPSEGIDAGLWQLMRRLGAAAPKAGPYDLPFDLCYAPVAGVCGVGREHDSFDDDE